MTDDYMRDQIAGVLFEFDFNRRWEDEAFVYELDEYRQRANAIMPLFEEREREAKAEALREAALSLVSGDHGPAEEMVATWLHERAHGIEGGDG